jgi:hypothetical protein
MNTRDPRATKRKRPKVPTAARRRGSSAADLKEQLDRRTCELTEAREQQAATADILRIISASPSKLQPVLEAVDVLPSVRPRRIIPCSSVPKLSNKTIQKGLAFGSIWSGSVCHSGRRWRSEILPRRPDGRGGASVVRRDAAINRTEDLDVKVSQAITSASTHASDGRNAVAPAGAQARLRP